MVELNTHYHLYLSTTLLLRSHLSDSLASTRKAVDATLTAYRLISEPGTLDDYKNQHRDYQFIKGYIGRKRKNDPDAFPLGRRYWMSTTNVANTVRTRTSVHLFIGLASRTFREQVKEFTGLACSS